MKENPTLKKNTGKNSSGKNEPSRFLANNNYFTISVYAIAVIFIGALILKLLVSWNGTVRTIKEIVNILMPFIIGALIAFILNPAVRKISILMGRFFHMKDGKLRKILAIAIAYLLVIGLIAVVFFGIVPQIVSSITDLVNYIPTAVNDTYYFIDNLEQHFPDLDMEVIKNSINKALPDVIIAIIVSIYMLSDKKPLKNSLKAVVYAFVPTKHITSVTEILKEAYKLFSSFIIGKALDSTIIGCLCFLFMTILQLPYAVLISVIVGITNMIPYFGPFIGAVPGALILLLISPVKAVIFVILILVLQQFDGLILGPKILGDSTGLKPLWIIVAITIGGSLGGVLGMFLGVPIVAFLRYLANRFLTYRLRKRNFLPDDSEPLA